MIRSVYLILWTSLMVSCVSTTHEKIAGVNLEMPPEPITVEQISSVKSVNAKWVAMIPFGFTRKNSPEVLFATSGHWWGESVKGTAKCIELAREAGLKVMIKPHVWVSGQGWPGDFELDNESDWKKWEDSYTEYIMAFANLADSMKVEIFCIGTEYRKAAAQRPLFWKSLIKKVRLVYDGKLTYAENWDSYHLVQFWEDLDYIGIDAYFPLSEKALPELEELKTSWKEVEIKLEKLSKEVDRPVLFTEYGYKSIEYTNRGQWNYKEDTIKTSMQAQATAYEAMFQSIWQKDWMVGGFFWKWHLRSDREIGGNENRRYTPQRKLTEQVISECYGRTD